MAFTMFLRPRCKLCVFDSTHGELVSVHLIRTLKLNKEKTKTKASIKSGKFYPSTGKAMKPDGVHYHKEEVVSETWPYLHRCQQQTQDPWTRDKGFFEEFRKNKQQKLVFWTFQYPCSKFHCGVEVDNERPKWMLHTHGNPELREPQSFIMGWKQTCMTCAPKRNIIFIILDSKQTRPLPWKEKLVLSSKAVHNAHILEMVVWNTRHQPLVTRCAETQKTHGELSPKDYVTYPWK